MTRSERMQRRENQVLAFPRGILPPDEFIPWLEAVGLLEDLAQVCRWVPRTTAEQVEDLQQPIPVAVVHDREGRVMTLRRASDVREDLKRRMTLVLGGHVERYAESGVVPMPANGTEFGDLLLAVLRRELGEEIATAPAEMVPVGIVVDRRSLYASQHVAFVWKTLLQGVPTVLAAEEFIAGPSSIAFRHPYELAALTPTMDPWSAILAGHLIDDEWALPL